MILQPNDKTAAVCGLFCGTCPSFPDSCHGCLSDKVAVHCKNCPNGIRECAMEHAVTRCYECGAFPCDRLEKFSRQHYQNGIGHHENVIKDLEYMRQHGVEDWVREQTEENTCSKCGKLIYWYDKKSHVCR